MILFMFSIVGFHYFMHTQDASGATLVMSIDLSLLVKG